MTNDGKREESWEVLPWSADESDPEFAIRIQRYDATRFRSVRTVIELSNQTDCCETIDLETPEQIDDLINRLSQARAWLIRERAERTGA